MNPRIQVEHTVTESITGRNLVQAQLLVAQGKRLSDPEIGIARQEDIQRRGFAIQCRITTEDPQNGFAPDYGVLKAYRSPGGFGVRLDAGSAFTARGDHAALRLAAREDHAPGASRSARRRASWTARSRSSAYAG